MDETRRPSPQLLFRLEQIYQIWYIWGNEDEAGMGHEKPLHWVGSAKKDYQAFPQRCRMTWVMRWV